MQQLLEQIAQASLSPSERVARYVSLFQSHALISPSDARTIAEHLANEHIPIAISRQTMDAFVTTVQSVNDSQLLKTILNELMAGLAHRSASFEEQVKKRGL